MVKIETGALLEVTQSMSGWAGTMFYPSTLKIRTSILSLLNIASCKGNRSGATAIPGKILRVSFPLFLAQGWKVISCVWLFTWDSKENVDSTMQVDAIHLDPSLSQSSGAAPREGLRVGAAGGLSLQICRSWYLSFPLFSFVSGLQISQGQDETLFHPPAMWRRIKDSSSWLTYIMDQLKPCRRIGHGL